MPNTIDGVLDWWAANRAEVAAVRSGDDTLNYAELRQWSLHAAAFLAERGLTAGDRLCIQAPNSFEYIAAMLGAIRLGAIAVPINPRIHPRERNDLIGDFEPRLLIVDTAADAGALPEDVQALPIEAIRALRTASGEADPPRGVDEDAIVGIISTSGSTSRPKGVMYSNRTVIVAAMQMLVQEPYCGEGARVLVYPSISTSAGFLPVFQILVFGGTIYLGGAFEPEAALKIIESERITMMMCSTIFFEHCAATSIFPSTDVSSLRAALTGGSPVSRELQRVWTEKGAVLRQIYGQTECSGFATFQSAEDSRTFPDKCGRGGPFTDIAIMRADGTPAPHGEPGEILLRGPTIMRGYWRAPEATAAVLKDDWLHTGDLGMLDERGNLSFIDRLKDVIKSGGYQISATELEAIINEIPAVESVAVIAVPDERFGETPMAIVYGQGSVTIADVLEHCGNSIARYKIPRYVVIEDAPLPRLATGKVAKAEIRNKYKHAHEMLDQVR